MQTIQETVEAIIRKTPFIEEALNENLINVSSLARVILPETSKLLQKEVKVGAVMMAINRLPQENNLRVKENIIKMAANLGSFIVRSNLCNFTFQNTPSLLKEIAKFLIKSSKNKDSFLTVSQGIFETNIVTSKNLKHAVKEIFNQEILINSVFELASITIKFSKENIELSGIYYYILKQLAWANISLQEIISTRNEMTIIVKEEDINQTFSILMDLKLQ